jgi:hypothetical protein
MAAAPELCRWFPRKVCGGVTVYFAVGWRVAVEDGACGSCHVSAGTWCVWTRVRFGKHETKLGGASNLVVDRGPWFSIASCIFFAGLRTRRVSWSVAREGRKWCAERRVK